MSIFTNFVSSMSQALFPNAQRNTDLIQYESPTHHPTIEDVLNVKASLVECRLPLELVDTVIDFAEYWPRTSVRRSGLEMRIRARTNENQFMIRSYPLGYVPRSNDPTDVTMQAEEYITLPPTPLRDLEDFSGGFTEKMIEKWTQDSQVRGPFPCRKIIFTIKSHDQGWGGGAAHRGTYEGSYSWFDVGLESIATLDDRILPPTAGIRKRLGSGAIDHGTYAASMSDGELISDEESPSDDESIPPLPLPHFRLPPPDEASSSSSKDSEPIICITHSISPRINNDGEADASNQFDHPLLPTSTCLQKNLVATQQTREYTITWSATDNVDPDSVDGQALEAQGRGRETATGEYVRNLKVGDCVTVWGKARFPGWVNFVEEVGVELYWAV